MYLRMGPKKVKLDFTEFFDSSIERKCHKDIKLTLEQQVCADILYFLRNRNAGLKGALETGIHPGPSGYRKGKHKIWCPNSAEECDGVPPMKLKFDPWHYWKHCKSHTHCKFVVKYHKDTFRKAIANQDLGIFPPIITMTAEDDYPLYLDHPNFIVREYARFALKDPTISTQNYKPYFKDIVEKSIL